VHVASLIADMLHSAGMAKIVLNARAGLLHAQQETFDMVICDLQMPGLDGRNFLAGLQESGNLLCERILFITGDAQAALRCMRDWRAGMLAPSRTGETMEDVKQAGPSESEAGDRRKLADDPRPAVSPQEENASDLADCCATN
jgi:CheY-like chemotaxis protein